MISNFKKCITKLKELRPYIGMLMLLFIIPGFKFSEEVRTGIIIFLIYTFWLFEIIPPVITALMPLVLFPFLHIIETKVVCELYMNDSIILFLGGLIASNAIQSSNLHKRATFTFMILMNKGAPWLILGFMLNSMFLSLWISNTVTTMLMVAVAEEILDNIRSKSVSNEPLNENKEDDFQNEAGVLQFKRIKQALMLSITYASSIGGMGTLVSTGSNILFKEYIKEYFPGSTEITFASWIIYNIPGMFLLMLSGWALVTYVVMKYNKQKEETRDNIIKEVVYQEYVSLGILTFQEKFLLALGFFILITLWFRNPKYMPGWVALFKQEEILVNDSVPIIAAVILFFIIPVDPKHFLQSPAILNWKLVRTNTSWEVIILIGGGFALAKGLEVSGLNKIFGSWVLKMHILPVNLMLAIIVLLTIMLTEFFNNISVAALMLPIITEVTLALKINPIKFFIPITLASSYSFSLPTASQANEIVRKAGELKVFQMRNNV
ncbi:solute carrier family 13 member 5-like isoform X2 [Centruroides sculpturatus]|uniref:solute carrier family 13 member 5-like isoform X2 n=1 Tax=Centruroides sculpturatus TaxID=218467 RepID=UPI000C6E6AF7|nr:solute carrier family 13 member 5-like isoform X2 [Centruroides sculpturatus]